MKSFTGLVFGLLFSNYAFATAPQVVPVPEDQSISPQMEFKGFGIATLNYGKNSDHTAESGINVSDSSFLFGASQRLYDGAIGSFGYGSLTTDSNNSGASTQNPFFVNQSFFICCRRLQLSQNQLFPRQSHGQLPKLWLLEVT